jgi:hypothetical protein
VQIGSAHFADPRVGIKIIDGLQRYLIANRIPDMSSLIGSLKAHPESPK